MVSIESGWERQASAIWPRLRAIGQKRDEPRIAGGKLSSNSLPIDNHSARARLNGRVTGEKQA